MSSDKHKQKRRSFDAGDLLNVRSKEVCQVPRSSSCDRTFKQSNFCRFGMIQNPTKLTEKELHEIMIDDCQTESEDLEKYGFGGYMPIRVSQVLGPQKEYQILRKIGWGQFSTVWLAKHRVHSQHFAIKVIKSAKKYRIAGRDEVKILQHIRNEGRENTDGYSRIIPYYSYFNEWSINGKHKCMLFDVMGPSLLDLLMKSEFRGFYEQSAKIILKQILEGVMFLHDDCNIIHTDLKPENILIVPTQSNLNEMVAYVDRFNQLGVQKPKSYLSTLEWQEYIQLHGEPDSTATTLTESSSHNSSFTDDDTKMTGDIKMSSLSRRPLLFINPNIQVKIADFGNACWENQQFSPVIQTIQYRALEVLIEAGYSFPADMWSIGCIAFEMCTGEFLFHPKSTPNMSTTEHHLGLIWEALSEIPKDMALSGDQSKMYFNDDGKLKKFDFGKTKIWPVENVLIDKFRWKNKEAAVFADFINRLIEPQPELRATAAMALDHKWVKEIED
ncbi:hypothetical protein ILUMI_21780 [Ignelater luminosus]|uniref:non-specific serine/threonine protein kinase n=1 Tax=Ignelater luminosus TaxID=2038154 RepID=A0A8K0G386_IGNLU|nr:hypothetical protein ILUMI_21780 [Ignelater luminosus]